MIVNEYYRPLFKVRKSNLNLEIHYFYLDPDMKEYNSLKQSFTFLEYS